MEHPLRGEARDSGAVLVHKSIGGTDWWRTTERHSMDGPTLGFWHEGGDGFEVSAEICVNPKTQYDQATLFLYISPTQWVKAGIEFDADALWNGAVVCNPYSDWSIAKRRPEDSARYTIAYTHNEVKVYLGNDMIREVKWFGATRSNDATFGEALPGKVFVGIMACSPKDGGAEVSWKNFTFRQGVRAR
ncbi:hypothetical protein CC85DRAFT_302790 [Cutaneotrichosporon oleaginosum]|uniref:Concanavalin A-like lectin/glucanase n=1 Tax=Cutaneotrichosporon oleaginosum TaxID=879819 RepID=A0A0J0XLF3_9TREE|nr:uncharacterized protein CC85DRAFT_302790 [Cutaneotrichosporon oleaginosum]KLT41912.1 hypothetical protein CC85DRAFT_302790 [Cutaneotrichosporon oleaginosum]TXT12512.1 hypothetical protein COLE_02922 [Cutaneotrichosporon oleaginosum]